MNVELEAHQIDNVVKAMTPSIFAALNPAFAEYMWGTEDVWGGMLPIARIHPNCNRPRGDEDVMARALVYMPTDHIEESHLRRLTIRRRDLDMDENYVRESLSIFRSRDWDSERDPATARVADYQRCLQAVSRLPMIDLHDPLRTWPPTP